MKINAKIIPSAIILLSFFFGSCRTLMLHQTADTLPRKIQETSFQTYAGAEVSDCSGPAAGFGVRHRQGLNDHIEIQYGGEIHFYMGIPGQVYPPFIYIYSDTGLKIQLLAKNRFHLSLIPYLGIFSGWTSYDRFRYALLGPATGIKILGSYRLGKKGMDSIYWGLAFQMKENFFGFHYIRESLAASYPASIPFPEFDFGLCFGIAQNTFTKKDRDVRITHELSFNVSFQTKADYFPVSGSLSGFSAVNPVFISAYGFSVGRRYSPGENKKKGAVSKKD